MTGNTAMGAWNWPLTSTFVLWSRISFVFMSSIRLYNLVFMLSNAKDIPKISFVSLYCYNYLFIINDRIYGIAASVEYGITTSPPL